MIIRVIAALALLPLTLAAQAPDAAGRVDVVLSSFKFTPATITLHHGDRYVLHLANQASGGHDFVAKQFFAGATVAPEDRPKLSGGGVDVGGGESVNIHLVAPAVGRYEVHCSHFMHSTFGMKGTIVVD